jgi:hypothetical protein
MVQRPVAPGGAKKPRIEAIITNHNTSALAEVALLSLVQTTRKLDRASLHITVTDNWSTDHAVDRLKRTAALVGATFTTTRWPHAGSAAAMTVDSLGDVWRDFVMSHDDCDFYWFIDSDVELTDDGTAQAMLDVFESHGDIWAVAANLVRSDSLPLNTVQGRLPAASEVFELAVERARGGRHGRSRKVFYGLSHPSGAVVPGAGEGANRPLTVAEEPGGAHLKCPSACTLIARTDVFATATRVIGFSPAAMLSGDTDLAGWYDDFALMTRVMQAAGYRYAIADTTVRHAFGGTWAAEHYDERANAAERTRQRLSHELGIIV